MRFQYLLLFFGRVYLVKDPGNEAKLRPKLVILLLNMNLISIFKIFYSF